MPQELTPHSLSLEIALIRWSVVHRAWHELGNDMPLIGPFLAGFFSRTLGLPIPEITTPGRDAFRVGWREADDQVAIALRIQPSPAPKVHRANPRPHIPLTEF